MRQQRGKAGFTLLELLAVMAMMIILMGIAGGAYFGMSRGASLRGAETNVRSALSLARQYAATRRSPTHVIFWQDETNAYYQTFVAVGKHAAGHMHELRVYGRSIAGAGSSLIGGNLYNLSVLRQDGYKGGEVTTNTWYPQDRLMIVEATNPTNRSIKLDWYPNEICGWAVRGRGFLPDGIQYEEDGNWSNGHLEIIYYPDGTCSIERRVAITMSEKLGEGQRQIVLRPYTGLVEFD